MVSDPEAVSAVPEPTTLAALLLAAQLPASADAETLGAASVLASGPPTTDAWEWWELTVPAADAPARYRVQAGRIERADGDHWVAVEPALLISDAPAAYWLMRALEYALIRDLSYVVLGRYNGSWRDVVSRALPVINRP